MPFTPEQRRADSLLRPWTRGRVALPFETSERTTAQSRMRALKIGLIAGAAAFVVIFGMMLAFGTFPSLYRVEGISGPPGMERDMALFAIGSGVVTTVAFGVIILPFLPMGSDDPARPWTYRATQEGLTIVRADHSSVSAAWSAWRLEDYDASTVTRNVPMITALNLSLHGTRYPVEVLRLSHQRRLLRTLVHRVGEPPHGR